MNLNRAAAVTLRHFYLIRSSLSRVAPIFVWIAVDIVLWGFISKFLNSLTRGFDFVPAFVGAILLWDFFGRVMHGVSLAFFEDVWSRNFLNFFASPLTVWEYTIGLVLSSIATSSAALLVMLTLAGPIFGLSFLTYGLMLAPFLLILFLFGIALGVFSAGMALRLGPAAEWFIWPIPALISPFVGVFYPLSTLPEWMQYISLVLPPAYVFEAMRAIIMDGILSETHLWRGAALAVLYIGLACRYFAHTYRHALRTGLIARYSAETLS